jgi:hypothetical protein
MEKIITESGVVVIGDVPLNYVSNRCCTRARAEALNCTVTSPSNAASNQLICVVKRAHDYVLSGSTSDSSSPYTFTSSKDGVWCDVTITVVSGTVGKAQLSHTGTTGWIDWTHGGSINEQIRIEQSGSGKRITVTLQH